MGQTARKQYRRIPVLIAAAAIGFTSSWADGVVKSWAPLFGTDWHNGLNWIPGGAPTANDDVIINGSHLVTLSNNTAAVNSIALLGGGSLSSSGFILNVQNTGETGTMTIGNGSRLTLGGAPSSADIDLLSIGNGGQVLMTSTEMEIDNRLSIGTGGSITGSGSIDLRALGSAGTYDVLVNNGTITAQSGTLQLLSQSNGRLNLSGTGGAGRLIIGSGGRIHVSGTWSGPFIGELRTSAAGTFHSDSAWTANGSVNLAANNSRISGATMTLGGSMRVGSNATNTNTLSQMYAPFTLNGGVIDIDDGGLNSSTTLRFQNVVTLNGGTITGSGSSASHFVNSVSVTGNTTINTSYCNFTTQDSPTQPDLIIQPGARLTLNSNSFGLPSQPSTNVLNANVLIDGGTLSVSRVWAAGAPRTIELRNGGRLTGERLTVDWILKSTGTITSFVDAPLTINGAIAGGTIDTPLVINGDVNLRHAIWGPTVFNNLVRFQDDSGALGPFIVLNAGAEFHSIGAVHDLSTLGLLTIAGNSGANSTVSLRTSVNSKDVSIGAAANSTGRVNVIQSFANLPWNVNGSVYIGGSQTQNGGIGTLDVGATTGTTFGLVSISQSLRAWPNGVLNMNRGQLTARHLLFDQGSAFNFTGGTVTLNGGTMTFPSDSYGFGGTTLVPALHINSGGNAAARFAINVGDGANTTARVNVTGVDTSGNPSTLRNFGVADAADIIIGRAGTGEILVADGGLVSAIDAIVFADQVGSNGAALVSGVVAGQRARLIADGRGSTSSMIIGNRGSALVQVERGGYLGTTGDLFLAPNPGSDAFLSASLTLGGLPAQIDVANDVVIGGTKTATGGTAAIEVSSGGRLAARDVIVRPQGTFYLSDGFALIRSLNNADNGAVVLPGGTLLFNGAGVSTFGTGTATIGDGTGSLAFVRVPPTNTANFDRIALQSDGRLESTGGVINANSITSSAGALVSITGGGRISTGTIGGSTGTISLNNGTLSIGTTSTTGLPVTLGSGGGTLEIPAARTGTFSGVISGAGGLRKAGTGTLILTGLNTYTGTTTILAGNIRVNASSMPGNAINDGILRFNQTAAGTYSGNISGTGQVIKEGAAVLTLTGSSTYSGVTTIAAGTLRLGQGDTLSDQTTVVVNPSATLDLAGNDERIGALSGSGTTTLGSAHLRVGDNNMSTTFSGVMSGAGGQLTKQGGGTFTLSGANTYTGGTTLESGTLLISNSAGSATGTGSVTIQSGATLAGDGTIAGSIQALPGAKVVPGPGIGKVAASDITFHPGSGLDVELAGTGSLAHDQVTVSGLAVLSGTLSFQRINNFQPLPGNVFDVLLFGSRIGTFDQIQGVTGFAGLSMITDYQSDRVRLRASARDGDANLDGVVNLQDFNRLATNFGLSGANWLMGDFNGDGVVNLQDFNRLAINFGLSASSSDGPTPEDWGALAAAVPEPGATSLLLLGSAGILSRRRQSC